MSSRPNKTDRSDTRGMMRLGHYCRQRAREARAEADKLDQPAMKQAMHEIAAAYERLALIAEQRNTTKAS